MRKRVALERRALERTLACCRSASGSSCRTGCGGLRMEPGTWGTLGHGRLVLDKQELAGKIGRMRAAGSLGPAVAGIEVLARSRRCRSDRTG